MNTYYVNVLDLMIRALPRPRFRCTLHDDRAEPLSELGIIHVSGIDGDYHDNNIN